MTAWVMVVLAANAVDGGLAITDVEDVLQLNAATLAPCFAGKKSPVKTSFEVDATGHVANVTTPNTCVRSALESVSFPTTPDAGSFVTWSVTKPSVSDAGLEVELLAGDALAAFDVEVTACYVTAGPTEKKEGSVSLEATVLRSGAMREVVLAEQSNVFVSTSLPACVLAKTDSWRLPAAQQVRRVRFGWTFATSERRVRSIFVPSERRREIIAAALPKAAEGLDEDVIMQVIRSNQHQIKYCYEVELQEMATLAGAVTAVWKIGPDGSVIQVSIAENTTQNSALGNCIVERVRRWKFPPPEGGGNVDITFPWIFARAGVKN